MPIVLTEGAILLVQLIAQNAIAAAFNQVQSMTPEQIADATAREQVRNSELMHEIRSH